MPIYAYRCESCEFQQDVLQKMSDPLLVTCPSCGEATFRKQVTAAGFQLKGSGWYVTDFRNPAATKETKDTKDGKNDAPVQEASKKADATPQEAKSGTGESTGNTPAPAPAEAKPAAPAAASAAGST